MPHVGKAWPRLISAFNQPLRPGLSYHARQLPPYGWKVHFDLGVGSLAVKWQSSTRLSEPGFINDDGWAEWHLNFDDDPDIYFKIVGTITNVDEDGNPQNFPYRKLTVSYWEGATMYGRRSNWNSTNYVQLPIDWTFAINNFQEQLNPALFAGFSGTGMRIHVAEWDDYPDYHPYRY